MRPLVERMKENMTKDGAEERRNQAVDWFMRKNDVSWSPGDEAAFEAWLASDDANRTEFHHIEGMFAHLTTMDFGVVRSERPARPARKWLRGAGLGASLAASLALLIYFDDLALYLRADSLAGTGETSYVRLADGSRVHLDARSAIATHIEGDRRRVTLLRGQAWFEVAPDPARPFVVEAAGGAVTALGTAFDVALDDGLARVIVTEHRVSISSGGRDVIVRQGQQSDFSKNAAARPPIDADIEREMSWRHGQLVFEDRSLDDVVRALSRYHRGKVVFLDPALRSRRVTGVFGVEDPIVALDEIQAALGLRMLTISRYLVLLY